MSHNLCPRCKHSTTVCDCPPETKKASEVVSSDESFLGATKRIMDTAFEVCGGEPGVAIPVMLTATIAVARASSRDEVAEILTKAFEECKGVIHARRRAH